MAEQPSTEGASTSGAPDSTLDLNIKTLDSQTYNFQVDKNMLVSSFKGIIADKVGVPVGQQRLIFRGKVLKDEHVLSEYHVESGDTLHLVERQPTQPQTSSGTGSTDAAGNISTQGIDGSAGLPRNRVGQISHSVVLGTLNVGDQGEGGASDLSRVIGAVLNSLGVGNQTTNATFGAPNIASGNPSGPLPQGNDTEQSQGGNGSQSQAGNQTQFGQPFLSQPFHVPLAGISIPPPSLNMPIPDSLNTLSEFISRMEGFLSQNGYQPSASPSGLADQPAMELPLNIRGLPTPEALSIVLRRAERLLSGLAAASLSHIAGRLEQESGSTDASVRSQIQSESVQVGLTMQHLGALLLELGRTILMLRMGQSPAEAVVNAGHAVYISPSGPNPIMVQPFPHQTSPLFSAPAVAAPNTGTSVPVGIIGSAPRQINIHIHAGTSLSPVVSAVGARAAGGEGAQGEHGGVSASGDSGATRVFPVRNVIAATVPSRTVSPIPTTSQPIGVVSTSSSPDAASFSSVISQVNSQIRNLLENMRRDNQTTPGQQENPVVPNSAAGSGGDNADTTDPSQTIHSESSGESHESHLGSVSGQQAEKDLTERRESVQSDSSKSNEESAYFAERSPSCKSGELADKSTGAKEVPLGLGGGLQPKRRSRQSQMHPVSGEAGTSSSPDQSEEARISGQQILQSLASRSIAGRSSLADPASGQTGQGFEQSMTGMQTSAQGSDGQLDVTGTMSQLLQSPALNGLLSGVAQQTGVGSPDILRNMLQQFTQNPAMRNTVNQLAQQVDTEEMRNMFSGMGSGEDGTLDFSSMIQQMMPVVSQVLGGGSVQNEQLRNMMPQLMPQPNDRSLEDSSFRPVSRNNIQEAVRIDLHSPSQDVFRSMAQNAAEIAETTGRNVIDELCSNQDLVNQFVEMLRCDLRRRLQDNSA
ncbi:large proline-rich protein BAG6-like isoform X2 [Chenopodium quinoa]|uniref:large proline-rich protein BAG6-like isoform X1 n=1 Tax=Chenopodium quinoa TaxID=63459 RepID=UPI000B784ABB|nr:large proline-rich protein BAG6-like isoform X1 [Chenopodium quinoa]XP_021737146.1 large proline-rich protein BAG6-like isoform X2 [Chenopodium quinoa]